LILSNLLQSFAAAIKPAVSDLDARGDERKLREVACVTQKYSLILLIPSAAFFVIMGREFLDIWVGERFAGLSTVLTILTLGYCARLSQYSNFLVLVGRGEHRVFGVLTIATALLCVALAVISVAVLDLGMEGIAWSNSVPMILTNGVFLPWYFCSRMKISMGDNLSRVWWPAFLGCAPALVMIGIWEYSCPPASWLHIGLVVVCAMLLTMVSAWFLSLSEIERKRFRSVIGVGRRPR